MTEVYSQLTEPFPKEVERQLSKGGARLTYIPVSEVITRLNKVLGIDKWSFEIVSCGRDSLDPDYIVAHVRLTWDSGNSIIVSRDGFGGQKIKRTKNGEIVDLGDEMKGAVSDALKKSAQTLGIGLYLARTEEAMEIEAELSVDPEMESMWNQFLELSKSLTPEAKKTLNEFWSNYSNGRPKPTRSTAVKSDIEALIGECLKLHMSSDSQ